MKFHTVECSSDERKFYEVWKLYEMATGTDEVVRSGYGMMGIYDYREAKSDLASGRRGESDSEHQYAAAVLVDGVRLWFPEVFPRYRTNEVVRLALLHDNGEAEIGDLPDDQSRDEEKKRREEYEAVYRLALHLPVDAAHMFLSDFRSFSSRDLSTADAGVRVAKLADKFEALLKLLRYEERGFVGRACIKADYYGGLTEHDRFLIEETGSENPTDFWSFSVFQKLSEVPEFRTFLGVLCAGLVDVRGEVFPWYEREIRETYGIDVEKLKRIRAGSEED